MRVSYKPWTTTEVAFLTQHYAKQGGAQVALELGRSYSSVNKKASLLGLCREYLDMADWGVDEIRANCRIDKTDEDSCWKWRGYSNTESHPYMMIGGRLLGARRRMYGMTHKQPVARHHCIVMACGESTCLNPKHMVQQHRQSVMRKGTNEALRIAKIAATHRRMGKLDESKVSEILASNEHAWRLAERFGVSEFVIFRVRRGDAWADKSLLRVV